MKAIRQLKKAFGIVELLGKGVRIIQKMSFCHKNPLCINILNNV